MQGQAHQDACNACQIRQVLSKADFSRSLDIVHLDLPAILGSLSCFLVTERDLADRWDRSDQERTFSSSVGIQQVDFIADMKFRALRMTSARLSKLLPC
jgi:hypothetical protein